MQDRVVMLKRSESLNDMTQRFQVDRQSREKKIADQSVRGRNAVVLYSRLGNNQFFPGKLSWMPDKKE